MPGLNEIWSHVGVDLRGLAALIALLLAALALGRLLAGRLSALPVHSPVERGLIWVLVGVTAFSWIGTLLAGLQLFRWGAALLALAAAVLLARRVARGQTQSSVDARSLPQTPRWAVGTVLALLALALWLYARPAESFFLVDDSAVYTLGGIVLAREGGLVTQANAFWPVSAEFAQHFYVHNVSGTISRFYGPFYQYFLGQPALEIGFLPLPKAWSAVAVWLAGPGYAAWSTPLFGVLGLAALYGLVRRAVNWRAALLATLLLGISLPQIWFARYPISEAYAQATILGGLYLALLARQNREIANLAFWSAASLALWTMIRLESVLLLPPLALVWLLLVGRDALAARGFGRTWLVTLTLFAAAGWGLSVAVSRHYLFDQSLRILTSGLTQWAVYAAALLIVALLIAYRFRRSIGPIVRRRMGQMQPGLWLAVIILWAGWGMLSLWALARGAWTEAAAGWLTFYLSPLGVGLGLAGVLALAWRYFKRGRGQPELAALLLVTGFLLLIYAFNPLVARWQPWAVRRMVPTILPLLALGAGAVLAWAMRLPLPRGAGRWRALAGLALGAGLLLAQVALEIRASRPILWHRELGGYAAQLEAIAEALPDDAVLLFDDGLTAQGLPQAFELWFGHPALALQAAPTGRAEALLDGLIEEALLRGRRVFFVATDGDLAWHPERWQMVSVGAQRIETTVLRAANGRAPDSADIVPRVYVLDMYEIRPRAETQPPATFALDASAGSYPYLRAGFYGWDQGAAGQLARWTDGAGRIVLPWPVADLDAPADLCLELALAGGRSAGAPAAHLTVQAEGTAVFDTTLPTDFVPQKLRIAAAQVRNINLSELEIDLLSTTWDASAVGDERTLGILFYGLEILPADACATPE